MSSMMGNQHDVTEECKIFKNTSNITIKQAQKDHDCYWKSHNKECPHEIIYDFVQKVLYYSQMLYLFHPSGTQAILSGMIAQERKENNQAIKKRCT